MAGAHVEEDTGSAAGSNASTSTPPPSASYVKERAPPFDDHEAVSLANASEAVVGNAGVDSLEICPELALFPGDLQRLAPPKQATSPSRPATVLCTEQNPGAHIISNGSTVLAASDADLTAGSCTDTTAAPLYRITKPLFNDGTHDHDPVHVSEMMWGVQTELVGVNLDATATCSTERPSQAVLGMGLAEGYGLAISLQHNFSNSFDESYFTRVSISGMATTNSPCSGDVASDLPLPRDVSRDSNRFAPGWLARMQFSVLSSDYSQLWKISCGPAFARYEQGSLPRHLADTEQVGLLSGIYYLGMYFTCVLLACFERQPWPPPVLFVVSLDNVLIRPQPRSSFTLGNVCSLSWKDSSPLIELFLVASKSFLVLIRGCICTGKFLHAGMESPVNFWCAESLICAALISGADCIYIQSSGRHVAVLFFCVAVLLGQQIVLSKELIELIPLLSCSPRFLLKQTVAEHGKNEDISLVVYSFDLVVLSVGLHPIRSIHEYFAAIMQEGDSPTIMLAILTLEISTRSLQYTEQDPSIWLSFTACKICGRDLLKPWDPGLSFSQCCILWGVTTRVTEEKLFHVLAVFLDMAALLKPDQQFSWVYLHKQMSMGTIWWSTVSLDRSFWLSVAVKGINLGVTLFFPTGAIGGTLGSFVYASSEIMKQGTHGTRKSWLSAAANGIIQQVNCLGYGFDFFTTLHVRGLLIEHPCPLFQLRVNNNSRGYFFGIPWDPGGDNSTVAFDHDDLLDKDFGDTLTAMYMIWDSGGVHLLCKQSSSSGMEIESMIYSVLAIMRQWLHLLEDKLDVKTGGMLGTDPGGPGNLPAQVNLNKLTKDKRIAADARRRHRSIIETNTRSLTCGEVRLRRASLVRLQLQQRVGVGEHRRGCDPKPWRQPHRLSAPAARTRSTTIGAMGAGWRPPATRATTSGTMGAGWRRIRRRMTGAGGRRWEQVGGRSGEKDDGSSAWKRVAARCRRRRGGPRRRRVGEESRYQFDSDGRTRD